MSITVPKLRLLERVAALALAIREARLPRYHGIWADRWNPKLGEYLGTARR